MSAQAIIDVKFATGYILDLFVAMALGAELRTDEKGRHLLWWSTEGMAPKYSLRAPAYSTDWELCGPLIHKLLITVGPVTYGPASAFTNNWRAIIGMDPDAGEHLHEMYGPTPHIAAMRCLVESKLGEAVTIPAALLDGYIASTERREEVKASIDKFTEQSSALVGIDAPRSVQPSDHVDVHSIADQARARVAALGKMLS